MAPITPSTIFTDIILSKYSVDQSSSFALSKFLSKLVIKSSPLITHPTLYIGSINSSAFSFRDESINNVSAAPQISGLLNLLLKIIFLAISRSASLSTYT